MFAYLEGVPVINYIDNRPPPPPPPPARALGPLLQRIEEFGSSSTMASGPVFRGVSAETLAGNGRSTPEILGLLVPSVSLPELPRETTL